MTTLNWSIFKAKFHQREQSAFESLSYMLFCYEHGIEKGIFRFKNQTGIETEPINHKEEQTGFQAKFYETKLSVNKCDIIESLKKAKAKNPELGKILIYTNQEHSESSDKNRKRPAYLLAIEKAAVQLKLKIEWRVNSHFEKQLSVPENKYLFNQYFETTKGVVDFLEALSKHSETILFPIHNNIQFAEKQIRIDRSSLLTELTNAKSKVIILSGDGGSGKTALIKEIWSASNPMYVLKAAEFNRASVTSVFRDFGQFGLIDFIDAHKEEAGRTVVIDSAEKLADLEDQEVFIEFLSALVVNEWRIIFTTRNSYLDDLRFQMLEIYRLPFYTISLENLSDAELEDLSTFYEFKLPTDVKLRSLIRNLFYLQEYLSQYTAEQDEVDYAKFRNLVWQKRIQQSRVKKNNIHLEREKCFLQIARLRCNTGNFFHTDLPCSGEVLSLLENDEIIKYEATQGGHFITHDIYEEWALEKLIEKEFVNFSNCEDFFKKLGPALPIRRAFRAWLSEKLLHEEPLLRAFIENAFINEDIQEFWKNELLISILLSDYCSWFFQQFEAKLFENDRHYLKLIVFLLRTACKEVDAELQLLMRVQNENLDPAIIFTKPKGKGWEAVISFLYQHVKQFVREDLTVIVPMLKEWISETSTGSTTRLAGLFALHFYKEAELNDSVLYGSENERQLLDIVLGAASELKQELTIILEELLAGKFDRRESFDSLRDAILGDNSYRIQFVIALPELTLRLADQSWYQAEKVLHPYNSIGVEKYYSIREQGHHDYYPASALQTPIYYLLKVAFQQTIQFILDFTNKVTAAYAESEYGNTVEEVEVKVDDVRVQQYLSMSLWCMYRGSGSPVTPYLLQSIHMALEKRLMEIARNTDGKALSKWLKYLLQHSNSASISAVIVSVVLAHPNKLFDVALVLFRNYPFFRYDNIRLTQEGTAEQIYSIWAGMGPRYKQFENDRLDTCKEPHRKKTLEMLVLESQFFRTDEVSETEVEVRRDAIHGIVDEMYASIKDEDSEIEKNKILRLFLARIDSRKMSPTVEHQDGNSIIHFNPKLTPDLLQFSQQGIQQYEEQYKYTALKLWAMSKFDRRYNDREYPKYEGDPEAVLKETKQLIEELNNGRRPLPFSDELIPAFTCATLIKEYSKVLSNADRLFCKEVIFRFASLPLGDGYSYQISDGVEVAISTLPYLYALFPKEIEDFNFLFLLILFDAHTIGEYKRVCDYAAEALRFKLCYVQPREANKILLTYLAVKPLLDKATDHRRLHLMKISRLQAIQKFFEAEFNQKRFKDIRPTKFFFKQIKLEQLDIQAVDLVFQSIPDDTTDSIHLDFIKNMLERFSKDFLVDKGYKDVDKIDHRVRNAFFRKFARFLLHRKPETIGVWLYSIVNPFIPSDHMASFISDVVIEQDRLERYEQFWQIWNVIYPGFRQAVQEDAHHQRDSLIQNYLLAWPYWKDTAREWHSLKPSNSAFFKKVCDDAGHHPEVLYSISKFLNEVGAPFLNDGLHWICDMLSRNEDLHKADSHPNTIYYLNHIARRFVYLNRTKIKTNRVLREKMLVLLNYLFTKGSVSGYLLREEVF